MDKPRLLDRVREALRVRHYSLRTEEAYTQWIRRFIFFHDKRHPAEMGEVEVEAFLSHLAVEREVAASTQNQALAALLFLYRTVLERDLDGMRDVTRAKQPRRLPVVLARDEVQRILSRMKGTNQLIASLLYGTGMRVMEGLRLRVKDIDFSYRQIIVREGKGNKDRVTPLPGSLLAALQAQLSAVREVHNLDLAEGFGTVYLPFALARKYPNALREWGWQYVFPSNTRCRDPRSALWRDLPPSLARSECSASAPKKRARRGRDQADYDSCAAAQFRDPPARRRLRSPHDPGVAGASGRVDDHDLHACCEQGRARRARSPKVELF